MASWSADKSGRFPQRLFLRAAEIDRDCERLVTAFLQQRHGTVRLLRAVDAMHDAERLRVMNDADRVGAMTDEAGQAALYSITNSADILDSLENGHARALWMFLKDPAGFGHAEEVRYADDRRYGRMWDGFECLPGLTVPRDGDPYTAFKAAIATHFDTKHVDVEICDRSRPSLEEEDAALIQVAIYREGRAGDRRAFVDGKLDRLPFRPVVEAAIIRGT